MHVLIGLGAAVALLYFWLLGHWFARVLVFLCLLVVAAGAGTVAGAGKAPGIEVLGIAVFIICAIVAWLVASVPTFYWRPRIEALVAASEARDKQLTKETMERFNRTHGLTG